MNDTITVCGIIATEPRHLVTDTGIAITSMRLASPSRRWDRATSTWTNGATNWYSVTAFRTLAANVHKSVKKGDRIVVTGRVRIRTWERDGRGGTSVEIDAEALGHDLAWGISNWIRVPRHASESSAPPGGTAGVDPRTGEVHAVGPGTHDGDAGIDTGDSGTRTLADGPARDGTDGTDGPDLGSVGDTAARAGAPGLPLLDGDVDHDHDHDHDHEPDGYHVTEDFPGPDPVGDAERAAA